MKVGIFRNSKGACDFYRATLPIQIAETNNACKTRELWAANLLYEAGMRTEKFWDVMSSDIYLIQRLAGAKLIKKIREFLDECGLKSKIVLDHDDDVFNVSPMSNHYVDYGTKELKIVHNGNTIHEWKDGVNIDIKDNMERIDEIKLTLSHSDMVTVTTDKLAEVFSPYNKNVRILPNCIDLPQWNKLNIVRENPDEIRICWAGGYSHWEDLFMIRQPLIEIGKKYPNVKILMLGYMPVSMERDFTSGQVEFHPWVETPAHPYRLAAMDIDIAVIPLKDTIFNRSKSNIKLVEFSALKIPSVVSYISPYKEFADLDNGENGVFIDENMKDGWFEGIEFLINNEIIRREIGQKARKTVEDNFDINKRYNEWINVYSEVLGVNSIQPITV